MLQLRILPWCLALEALDKLDRFHIPTGQEALRDPLKMRCFCGEKDICTTLLR